MKPLPFKNCRFLQSSSGEAFPAHPIPHFVLVGRSNVGKSSLINHLFNNRSLAKVSSTPGKTSLINFFLIDEKAFLVDLPGYGYAKREKQEQKKWPRMVENYFQAFPDAFLIHLLDSRHEPSEEDRNFLDWAKQMRKKPLFIFTKIDKIQKTVRKATLEKLAASLGEDSEYIAMTIKEGGSREELIKAINEKY